MSHLYDILSEQFIKFPLMEVCDAVKLIYQAEFGGGHKVNDEYYCMKRIENEGSNLSVEQLTEPYFQEIGGGYSRMNMSVLGILPVELLGRMFIESTKCNSGTQEGFERKVLILRRLAEEGKTAFTENVLNCYLNEYRQTGYHPVSHSKIYTDAYHPAYRVVKNEYCRFLDVFVKISRLYATGSEVTIGIDGRSFSGKKALAKLIETVFDCNIFYTRDFFNFNENKKFVSFDRKRLKSEILSNLNTGSPYIYSSVNSQGKLIKHAVAPKRLNIIVGSYALHPSISKYYELKIFMGTDNKAQSEKIIQNTNPIDILEFESRINEYLTKYNIEINCDVIYK